MSRTLSIRNRQRLRRIDTALLRRITLHILQTRLVVADFELAIHLVTAPEMARVNKTFLNHEGSTDVITFDHSANVGQASSLSRFSEGLGPVGAFDDLESAPGVRDRLEACPTLHGELFICIDDAMRQAREFRTSWQSELVRYVIHGLLHLCGHDDLKPVPRRHMKRAENHLLREVNKCFTLTRLGTRNPKPETSKSAIGNRQSAI